MPKLPDALTRDSVLAAIKHLDEGGPHAFSDSVAYDLLYEGRRYAPKAVAGIAAGLLTGQEYGPYDFKGGFGSTCFRLLEKAGFEIVPKAYTNLFPDEPAPEEVYSEGSVITAVVNRYERSPKARAKCIAHYGTRCSVCLLDFGERYGSIGEGFIHVHHLKPISSIETDYAVDPVTDLRPVCPNCHAMLHRKSPPFTIGELKALINEPGKSGN